MWGMMFASGLQMVASANADKAAGVAPEETPQGIPNMEGRLPTPQELLEMLDSLTGISDEEKATLREELLRNIQEATASAGLPAAGSDMTMQTMVLLSLLALVALIFGKYRCFRRAGYVKAKILGQLCPFPPLPRFPNDSR